MLATNLFLTVGVKNSPPWKLVKIIYSEAFFELRAFSRKKLTVMGRKTGTFHERKGLINRGDFVELDYLKHVSSGLDKDSVLSDLMNEYGNDVWNFAYFIVRQSKAADDISQEVFLAVYDKLYSFRGESSLKSWLLTITRNKSLKYLKSALIRKVMLVDYVMCKGSVLSSEAEAFDRQETRHIMGNDDEAAA
jgi:hypothetical protein